MLSVARNRKQYLLEDVLVVGICEGLRRNEFFNLQWRHVDEKRRLMTLRDTKSNLDDQTDRMIDDVRPRTLQTLRAMRERTGVTNGPVFRKDDGSPFSSVTSLGIEVNRQLKDLAAELKLPDPEQVMMHPLRHTSVSWHYADDPDPERTRIRYGWKSVKMVFQYTHLLPRGIVGEVRAFWNGAN